MKKITHPRRFLGFSLLLCCIGYFFISIEDVRVSVVKIDDDLPQSSSMTSTAELTQQQQQHGNGTQVLTGGTATMNMIETPTLAPSSEAPDMTQIDKTSTKTSRKNVLQKVAKLLSLPTQEDLDDFQFYVYDDIPNHYQPKTISKCVEDYGIRNSFQNKTNVSDVERQRRQQNFYDTYCDWSTSICSPKAYTTSCHYSDRRLNRNADAILATHFVQYTGPLRTYDPESAKIFIVPYPASSQKECYRISSSKYNKKLKATITDHERTLLKSLKYWKQHPTKHLFLYSAGLDQSYLLEYVQSRHNNMIAMLGPKRRLGHIVIPYANTHPEYQPNQFFQLQLQPDELNQRHSKTASINQSTSPF